MEKQFDEYNDHLDQLHDCQDSVRSVAYRLSKISKSLGAQRQKLHSLFEDRESTASAAEKAVSTSLTTSTESKDDEVPKSIALGKGGAVVFESTDSPFPDQHKLLSACVNILNNVETLSSVWKDMEEAIAKSPSELTASPDVYRDLWRDDLNDIIVTVTLAAYLFTGRLVNVNDMTKILHVPPKISLPLYDYLTATATMPTELARFSINAVRARLFDAPSRIYNFIAEVYSGFRLLNLRNDAIRRRFDTIKYALSSAEDVAYNVEIRGLAREKTRTRGDSSASTSGANAPAAASGTGDRDSDMGMQ